MRWIKFDRNDGRTFPEPYTANLIIDSDGKIEIDLWEDIGAEDGRYEMWWNNNEYVEYYCKIDLNTIPCDIPIIYINGVGIYTY